MSKELSAEVAAHLRELLDGAHWTFAKTMPHNPHEYIVAKHWPGREQAFADLVALITAHGYTEDWYGKPYTYVHLDGYRMWAMPGIVPGTMVVNRKPLEQDA